MPVVSKDSSRGGSGEAKTEWVSLPGGTFLMGSSAGADASPVHRVTVKPFQMSKTMVTNRQYKACMAAGACTEPKTYGPAFDGDDNPVVGVDWKQSQAYAAWAGARLPSEAEWEYAARGAGKSQDYPWGAEKPACDKTVLIGCARSTMPVCSRPAGNTKQGLCDMSGNSWAWVQDWYHESYQGAPTDGSAWEKPAGTFRVFRGGSWNDKSDYLRTASRGGGLPTRRCIMVGIRLVR